MSQTDCKELDVVSEIKKINKLQEERLAKNPLAAYSTHQLKRELRYRKKNRIHF